MEPFAKTEFEKCLEQLILETPAPGKHCARNAFRHLEKASQLADYDQEMAAFRAITAEEEAASAVFHALRRHKYDGWQKLNARDHRQKNGVIPFCLAIQKVLEECDKDWELEPQLTFDLDAKKIGVRFNPKKMLNTEHDTATFDPPLEFSLRSNSVLHDFSKQLEYVAVKQQADSFAAHLRERANRRNSLLYASAQGVPTVRLNKFLLRQRERVGDIPVD